MIAKERLRVTYELTCEAGEKPEAIAVGIAYEQTVELPDECLSDAERERTVGRLEELEAIEESVWEADISYTTDLVGGSLVQLLNLIYGNVSLQPRVRVVEVAWPATLLETVSGPGFGIDGLRRLCRAPDWRPLTCAVAKPVGLSVDELAQRCRALALGGVDLIKDDHSLGDQPWAPFYERVARCQSAIAEANRQVDGATVYLPTLGVTGEELTKRVQFLHEIGCQGATVLPVYQGFETIRDLAVGSNLVLLGHPSGSGAFFNPTSGIAPDVLLGQIFRLSGCDIVNFPRAGGRFPVSGAMEEGIVRNLRSALGRLRPSVPAPGGSVAFDTLSPWLDLYGPDTVFVVGATLFRGDDVREIARRLVGAVEQL